MFGVVAVLWLIVVMLSGHSLEVPNPISSGARTLAAITAFVDVLAQQLPTFGLLPGLGMKHERTAIAFGLDWYSYTFAHLIGSSLPLVGVALIGLLFGALLLWTKNLGAGLGIHGSFYFMRAIFGWGA